MVNYHLTITTRPRSWLPLERLSVGTTSRNRGIVMNKNDGSVYCELQGPIEIVKQLIFKIKAGPTPYARINKVKIIEGSLQNYHHSFPNHALVRD